MSTVIFKPRINNYDMSPRFYDHNYQVDPQAPYAPGSGPTMANPYNIQSSTARLRESAYLWGRWYETLNYPPNNKAWSADDRLGYIYEKLNGVDHDYGYWTYSYWQDPSIYDHTTIFQDHYTYEQGDNIIRRVSPADIGDIVTFIDLDGNNYYAGVVEYFNDVLDYYISFLDTTQHIYPDPEPVRLEHITGNTYNGIVGHAIASYYSTFEPGLTTRIIGKPIGVGSKTWLYAKRYYDIRKGNDL